MYTSSRPVSRKSHGRLDGKLDLRHGSTVAERVRWARCFAARAGELQAPIPHQWQIVTLSVPPRLFLQYTSQELDDSFGNREVTRKHAIDYVL